MCRIIHTRRDPAQRAAVQKPQRRKLEKAWPEQTGNARKKHCHPRYRVRPTTPGEAWIKRDKKDPDPTTTTGPPVKDPSKTEMVIFRENTEDIYAGIEFQQGSEEAIQFAEKFKSMFPEKFQKVRFPGTAGYGINLYNYRRNRVSW